MTLADTINRMILTIVESLEITSANPTHTNIVMQANQLDSPDLESAIQELMPTTETGKSLNFSKELSGISTEDAKSILGKAGIDPQNIPNLLKMGTSGSGIAGAGIGAFSSIFPPAVITMLVLSMIPEIIKELQRPGGIFDKRVKIDARNEAFSVLDRQTRQNTRIGDRQVIIQQFEGFRNYEGFASTSTHELINKNADRVLDIGLFDRAQGMSSR